MTKENFDRLVDNLCAMFDCSVTSGRRTPKRNAAVKGHPFSKHLLGLAADIVPDEDTPEMRAYIVSMAQRLGVGAKDEGDHVHLQVRV